MKVNILAGCRASGEHQEKGTSPNLSKDDALILISLGKAKLHESEDSNDEAVIEANGKSKAFNKSTSKGKKS